MARELKTADGIQRRGKYARKDSTLQPSVQWTELHAARLLTYPGDCDNQHTRSHLYDTSNPKTALRVLYACHSSSTEFNSVVMSVGVTQHHAMLRSATWTSWLSSAYFSLI
jgi:hypothetical protein